MISVEPKVVHIRHVTLKKVSFVNAPLYYVVSSTVVQKRPPIFIHYYLSGVHARLVLFKWSKMRGIYLLNLEIGAKVQKYKMKGI